MNTYAARRICWTNAYSPLAILRTWKFLIGVFAACFLVFIYILTGGVHENEALGREMGYPQAKYVNSKVRIPDHRPTMDDIEYLGNMDDIWRENGSLMLGEIVQDRLHKLQNPRDCTVGKKIVCSTAPPGFGSNIHHLVYCLIIALSEGRPLLIQDGWPFSHDNWTSVFLPISETCQNISITNVSDWTGDIKDDGKLFIKLPLVGASAKLQGNIHLPPAVPEDFAPFLKRLHGQPSVWWIGQLLKYLLRPQPELRKHIKQRTMELGFKHPIVGVHVRRTDKNTEASYYPIEKYMEYVKTYFDEREQKGLMDKRRVYLATDEPSVITEAQSKFPTYEFITDPASSKTAGHYAAERNSKSSLWGIIVDIDFLSRCDYLVCTFSSNVCRLVYALMQPMHGDASSNVHSLDSQFYFHAYLRQNRVTAVERHVPLRPSEIAFEIGDPIAIAGHIKDGYSRGENMRTRKHGLFPSYKVDTLAVAKFPIPQK